VAEESEEQEGAKFKLPPLMLWHFGILTL